MFTRLYKELGVIDFFVYLFHRFLQLLSKRLAFVSYKVMVLPVPRAAPALSRFTKRYCIRELKRGDANLQVQLCGQREVNNRFLQGGTCFAAYKNEQLVGYIWLICGAYLEQEYRSQMIPSPSSKGVWDCDIYVDESDRLGLCFTALWQYAFQWMRGRDYQWSASRISGINPRSLTSHEKLGGEYVGRQFFLRFNKTELYMSNMSPYLHLSSSIQGAPKVYVCRY